MATGQTILNLMEALDPELQLQSGEVDVTKALLVLNASQDALESLLAQEPKVKGSAVGSVVTAANVETTTFPAGVLRIDGLDFVDSSTGLPSYPLNNVSFRGGHRYPTRPWWLYMTASSSGAPVGYWTNGTNIYWDPLPDAVYTVRYYGFAAAADITASGTFAYADAAMLPLAALTVRIIRAGLDDAVTDTVSLMKDTLTPLVDMLAQFNRDGASPMRYDFTHDT